MNKITRPEDLMVPKVTTGAISGSSKVYSAPEAYPDVRVPFRQIALSDPDMPTFRVYDSSGPYTDPNAVIDVEKGMPRIREAWIKERGGVESYLGRDIQPEDNGNVSGKALARDFPNKAQPLRGIEVNAPSPQPSPQGERGLLLLWRAVHGRRLGLGLGLGLHVGRRGAGVDLRDWRRRIHIDGLGLRRAVHVWLLLRLGRVSRVGEGRGDERRACCQPLQSLQPVVVHVRKSCLKFTAD